jgi:hypothetical protein
MASSIVVSAPSGLPRSARRSDWFQQPGRSGGGAYSREVPQPERTSTDSHGPRTSLRDVIRYRDEAVLLGSPTTVKEGELGSAQRGTGDWLVQVAAAFESLRTLGSMAILLLISVVGSAVRQTWLKVAAGR